MELNNHFTTAKQNPVDGQVDTIVLAHSGLKLSRRRKLKLSHVLETKQRTYSDKFIAVCSQVLFSLQYKTIVQMNYMELAAFLRALPFKEAISDFGLVYYGGQYQHEWDVFRSEFKRRAGDDVMRYVKARYACLTKEHTSHSREVIKVAKQLKKYNIPVAREIISRGKRTQRMGKTFEFGYEIEHQCFKFVRNGFQVTKNVLQAVKSTVQGRVKAMRDFLGDLTSSIATFLAKCAAGVPLAAIQKWMVKKWSSLVEAVKNFSLWEVISEAVASFGPTVKTIAVLATMASVLGVVLIAPIALCAWSLIKILRCRHQGEPVSWVWHLLFWISFPFCSFIAIPLVGVYLISFLVEKGVEYQGEGDGEEEDFFDMMFFKARPIMTDAVNLFDGFTRGASKILVADRFFEMLGKVFRLAYEGVTGHPFEDRKYIIWFDRMSKLTDAVQNQIAAYKSLSSIDLAKALLARIPEVSSLEREVLARKLPVKRMVAFDTMKRDLAALEPRIRSHIITVETIPKPVGVMIIGPPRSGKDTFVNYAIEDLKYKGNSMVWPMNEKFVENFNDQKVIIIQDAHQNADKTTLTEEIERIRALIESVPQPVAAAAIEKKGANFSAPHIVFVTTNRVEPYQSGEHSLTDIGAYYRRFEIILQLTEVKQDDLYFNKDYKFTVRKSEFNDGSWTFRKVGECNYAAALDLIQGARNMNLTKHANVKTAMGYAAPAYSGELLPFYAGLPSPQLQPPPGAPPKRPQSSPKGKDKEDQSWRFLHWLTGAVVKLRIKFSPTICGVYFEGAPMHMVVDYDELYYHYERFKEAGVYIDPLFQKVRDHLKVIGTPMIDEVSNDEDVIDPMTYYVGKYFPIDIARELAKYEDEQKCYILDLEDLQTAVKLGAESAVRAVKIRRLITALGLSASAVGFAAIGYALLSKTDTVVDHEPQSLNWDEKKKTGKATGKKKGFIASKVRIEQQAANSTIVSTLMKQTLEFTVQFTDGATNAVKALAVNDRFLLVPKHVLGESLELITGVSLMWLVNDNRLAVHVSGPPVIVDFPHDLVLVRLPAPLQGVKDITNTFISDDVDIVHTTPCVLAKYDKIVITSPVTGLQTAKVENNDLYYSGTCELDTFKGDCGFVYLSAGTSSVLNTKIIGLHSGIRPGLQRHKIIARMNRESLIDAMKKLMIDEPTTVSREFQSRLEKAGFTIVGPSPKSFPPPRKHNIEKTPIHGYFGPSALKPALMIPKHDVNPLYNAISDWTRKKVDSVPIERLMHLEHYMRDTLLDPYGYPLTAHEAVNGNDEYDSLDLSTSYGYPNRGEKKRYAFEAITRNKCHDHWAPKLWFVESLVDFAKKLSDGVFPDSYAVVSLKCELRKIAKVDSGQTRAFMISPAEMVVLGSMIFKPLLQAYKMRPCESESSVGINPHSMDPSRFMSFYHNKDLIMPADYRRHDKSVNPEHGDAISASIAYHLSRAWGDEYTLDIWGNPIVINVQQFVHTYLQFSCKGPLIVVNTIAAPIYHISSGDIVTALLNCMHNKMLWCDFLIEKGVVDPNSKEWTLEVAKILRESYHGDDVYNMLKVRELRNVVNLVTFADFAASRGLECTPASKTGGHVPFLTVSEATYLKRTFKKVDGIWRFPREESEILECFNWWEPRVQTWSDYLGAVIDSSLTEFHHFGRSKFNERRKDFMKLYEEQKAPFRVFKTYDDISREMCLTH